MTGTDNDHFTYIYIVATPECMHVQCGYSKIMQVHSGATPTSCKYIVGLLQNAYKFIVGLLQNHAGGRGGGLL